MKALEKIDKFLNEVHTAKKYPYNTDKYTGERAIQFLKWWNYSDIIGFVPGDSVRAIFGEEEIELVGAPGGGHFAGADKVIVIDDPDEMDSFKSAEGNIWMFV